MNLPSLPAFLQTSSPNYQPQNISPITQPPPEHLKPRINNPIVGGEVPSYFPSFVRCIGEGDIPLSDKLVKYTSISVIIYFIKI
jgi:hypothetical protein